jgi:hypothetical protein
VVVKEECGIRHRMAGSWSLREWQTIHADGSISHPLGSGAHGQLMYDTDDDRVSVHLVRAHRPVFASDDWRQATAAEMCAAWPSCFGYFGRFTVDVETEVITHHVEAGCFPNIAGTEQERRYRFEDDVLVLDADTAWGRVRVIWSRP